MNLPKEEYFAKGHRACAGCGSALAMRIALKAAGKNTIITHATGCMEVVSTPYPETAWKLPWVHTAFENAAAVASGIESALKKLNKKTNVLAIGGDGGTFDIGLQALSGAIERQHDFCYLCYENAGYMNCLSLDTLIMTEEGLKNITDVKVGDRIYAFNQKNYQLVLKKCTGVFDNGIKKVYKLRTLHHSIKATSNHPFLTLKRSGKGRGKKSIFVWKTLAELKKGDEIVVLKSLNKGKSFSFKPIKISKKGDYKVNYVKLPKKSSSELMEFLGFFVGDGWIRAKKAETGFALPENTKGRKKLIELCKKLFNSKIIRKNKGHIYLYSINLARFIDSLGFGKGAKNKIVPPWVFTLTDEEKEAFLKGLMLSDGYLIGKSHRYVSASIDLLKTLRLLLQTMNYRVGKVHQQTKKRRTHVVYRQLLEDSTYGYICFSKKNKVHFEKYPSQTRSRDFLVNNEFFSTERIDSINFVKEEPTLDLRVKDEHNFVADGIVVHNTGVQRSGATPKYASTTTTPAGKKTHGKIEYKKPLPLIIAAHGAYVATANIAFPIDFYNKLKKALEIKGPAYVQVFAPCPLGWRHASNLTIEIAKLAFNSKITPLYEIENGVVKFYKEPSIVVPVKDYLKPQGRFKHLNEEEIKDIQNHVDEQYNMLKRLEETGVKLS